MINLVASLRIKEGRISEFIEIFKANIPNVLQEKGCLEYMPTVDVPTGMAAQDLNPNVVTVIEKWACLEDLQAHMTAPHMLVYAEAVKDLLEGRSLKILRQA